MRTAPDTIVAGCGFWIDHLDPQPAPAPLLPHDGYPERLGCACIRVDWVDDHMFGGTTAGTRYVVDRTRCPDWETFSLVRLPRVVSVGHVVRKIPLHFRAMYSRVGEDEYVMRGQFLSCWSK